MPHDPQPGPDFLAKHQKLSRGLKTIATATTAAIRRLMGKDEAKNINFSLFVWHNDPESGGGWTSYIGTSERKDIIPVLKAMLERWEAGEPEPPVHELH